MKNIISLSLAAVLLLSILSGCSGSTVGTLSGTNGYAQTTNGANQGGNTGGTAGTVPDVNFSQVDSEMFTDRDTRTDYDESTAVKIQLNGTSATASSNSVKINGSTVQITEEATYIIYGTLDDGMLVVNAPDTAKLQLVFQGVDITSSDCAALYIMEANKVFLTLADGTKNSLTNGGSFTAVGDENVDAALYSKQDLTINGSGQLTVTSPAGHGIVGKDDLVITGGTIQIDAANHALDANDSVRFTGADLTATAGKDGIHCENSEDASRGFVYVAGGSMDIKAEGDGISAGYYLYITGGTFDILAGGGYENGDQASSDNWGGFPGGSWGGGRPRASSTGDDSTSMKGIKTADALRIEGGSFTIDSADDALHADTDLMILGGSFTIASGDDALHAEDTLTVTDCQMEISTCYEGLEALHIEVSGGNIKLKATDDGLNAAGGTDSSGTGGRDDMFGGYMGGWGSSNSNGSIVVSGGTLYINSSGDGMDANGTLEISGGQVTIVGPTSGDTATLDYDKSGIITGGTFIGTGSSMMAQTFSDSGQGVIAVQVGTQSAGTQITVTDDRGNVYFSYAPELSFQVVILSSPQLVSGQTYTITIGSQSGDCVAS